MPRIPRFLEPDFCRLAVSDHSIPSRFRPGWPGWLIPALLVAGLCPSPAGPLGAGEKDPPEALERLRRGEKYILRGKIGKGVRELRDLLEKHALSEAAVRGRRILAERGFGPRTQVVFLEPESLRRRGLREAELIATLEGHLGELWSFFAQTYGGELEREFQIYLHDSRARYLRQAGGTARRRSRSEEIPA